MSFLTKIDQKRRKEANTEPEKRQKRSQKRGETYRVPIKAMITQTICMAEEGSFVSIYHCVG